MQSQNDSILSGGSPCPGAAASATPGARASPLAALGHRGFLEVLPLGPEKRQHFSRPVSVKVLYQIGRLTRKKEAGSAPSLPTKPPAPPLLLRPVGLALALLLLLDLLAQLGLLVVLHSLGQLRVRL